MRYKLGEGATIAGILPTGGSVTVKIIDMASDILLSLSSSSCTESSHISGVYLFDIDNITTPITDYTNCLYEMTDGSDKHYGKFVLGGYPESLASKGDVYGAKFL
jgi:hypothetical protein